MLLVAVVALVVSLFAPAAAAADDATVSFNGAGWGHGVGLSQYGAYGMATREGASAAQILGHFYQGATLARLGTDVPAAPRLWVNLQYEKTAVTLLALGIRANPTPVTVTRGAETWTLNSGDRITIEVVGGSAGSPVCGITVTPAFGAPGARSDGPCVPDLVWDGDEDAPSMTMKVDGCSQIDWNELDPSRRSKDCQYGRGLFHVRPDANTASFHVVAEMDIDDYILGISEMPYYWGTTLYYPAAGGAALEAQAVAARSYAHELQLYRGEPNATNSCAGWCHVRDTTFDQRYVGWGHGGYGQDTWIAAANATAGLVLAHAAAPTKPAGSSLGIVRAYYSSSSGGASENVAEVFNQSQKPYLASVPDPWAKDPKVNPNAAWSKTVSAASLAAAVGLDQLTAVAVTARHTSGSVDQVTFTGLSGTTPKAVTRSGEWVKSTYGLRSIYFDVSDTLPKPKPLPKQSGPDRVALQDPTTGIWHMRGIDGSVSSFYYGNPLDIPYAGDWNGDGVVTMGLYRVSAGYLFLRNSNTQGIADIEIFYGNPGDLPIAGDWNGDGIDTVGIFRTSDAKFYLRNTNTQGIADITLEFGQAGDVPLAGDWNGDGIDTVGVYRPSTKMLYLTNSLSNPTTDVAWPYSGARDGDRVIAGDWNHDGIDTVGVYRPSDRTFYLRDTFPQPAANVVIEMGEPFMNPVAGFWGG
jgi:SpoIID/LytB domain protein